MYIMCVLCVCSRYISFHFSPFLSLSHLGVPRVSGGRTGRRKCGEDVRLAERRKSDLSLGISVRAPGTGEDAVLEHDERGTKRLRVEEIPERHRR